MGSMSIMCRKMHAIIALRQTITASYTNLAIPLRRCTHFVICVYISCLLHCTPSYGQNVANAREGCEFLNVARCAWQGFFRGLGRHCFQWMRLSPPGDPGHAPLVSNFGLISPIYASRSHSGGSMSIMCRKTHAIIALRKWRAGQT